MHALAHVQSACILSAWATMARRAGPCGWAGGLLPCLVVLALASAAAAEEGAQQGARKPAELHNPLELFRVENVELAAQPGARVWSASPELAASGQWLEVFWSGVHGPKPDDLVALYVPADADPTKVAPVKFQRCARSATHSSVGAGRLR